MSHARKFFSESVSSGTTTVGVSLGSIMSTAGWGWELDSDNLITTVPSLDSTIGTGLTIIPAAILYFGQDQYVRDAAAAGPPRLYKGVPAVAGQPFDVVEYCRGLVDIYSVFVYSPGGAQELQIVFKGT